MEKLDMKTEALINTTKGEIGIIGLGVMGRNLLLNMAEHGFSVVGYDKDANKVESMQEESKNLTIRATLELKTFMNLLRRPRAIMLLVPAGSAVDSVIQDLFPYLEAEDLIIDAGNSYFKDTDIRTEKLNAKGFQFLGIGISGGEYGARHGPSIMPGGKKESYDRIQTILQAIAAKVKGDPCVTYLGKGSSGHFVKMVHNGIEYGMMQLISESYDLMKRGLGLNDKELRDIYTEWNKSELNGYLIEITGYIFDKIEDNSGKELIDLISSVAKQMGTGFWTAKTAMELQVPTPTISAAVTMRDLSTLVTDRIEISKTIKLPIDASIDNDKQFITELRHALFAGIIIVYTEGMSLLKLASDKYEYDLNLQEIARIWRGGCIIRSAFLEDIYTAFRTKKDLTNLLLDSNIAQKILQNQESLRKTVSQAVKLRIPTPGLMASLNYLTAMCSDWLPSNLIQAQRDYFGSHGYERIDIQGSFHTDWGKK